MLTMFQVKRTFQKLTVSVLVDCEKREADLTVTYDRCIIRTGQSRDFHYAEVDTPAKAEAWLIAPMQVKDGKLSRLEWLEQRYRAAAYSDESRQADADSERYSKMHGGDGW